MNKNEKLCVFSERLLQERTAKNMTQEQLAQKIGGQKQMISQYETLKDSTKGLPTLFTAIKIAQALDASLDWLCGLPDRQNSRPLNNSDIERKATTEILFLANVLEEKSEFFRVADIMCEAWIGADGIEVNLSRTYENAVIASKNGTYNEFMLEYGSQLNAIKRIESDKKILEEKKRSMVDELKQNVINKYIKKLIDNATEKRE